MSDEERVDRIRQMLVDELGRVVPRKGEEYVCAECGGTFVTDWTPDEALHEAAELPVDGAVWDAAGAAVVCDDCFNELVERHGLQR